MEGKNGKGLERRIAAVGTDPKEVGRKDGKARGWDGRTATTSTVKALLGRRRRWGWRRRSERVRVRSLANVKKRDKSEALQTKARAVGRKRRVRR